MPEYYQYKAFGINILSALHLPELTPQSFTQEDVFIKLGKNPLTLDPVIAKGALFQANKGSFLFKLDQIASYHVQNGREITIEKAKDASSKDVQLFLMGPVFGALFHQKGILPLHASSVVKNSRATIFCGSSGTGKSTLAAMLTLKGYSILADDISLINTAGRTSSVIPGIPNLKLWQDVAEQLYKNFEEFPRVRDQLLRYTIPGHFSKGEEVNHIENIIILDKKNSAGFELKKITGVEKFTILKDNTYKVQYIEGLGASLNHFYLLTELIQNVNIFVLRRPNSPLLLKEMVEFIEANRLI